MADLLLLSFRLLGNLPLDRQRPFITDFLKRSKVVFHADIAVSEWNFLSPLLAWIVGPLSIFAVDAADAIPNLLQGFNRLASSIEDHVGWVEIDEQVIPSDVVNELHQAFCRFLTRLKMKVLSICFAMVEESRVTATTSW